MSVSDHGLEVDDSAPRRPDPALPSLVLPRWAGALAGVASGAFAVVVGMLVASIANRPSPIDAVGSSFIDRTPRWLKDLAIDWFGTNDKTALRVGIVIVLALVAAILGTRSTTSIAPLSVGIAVFAVIGALSTAERPGSNAWSVVAPLIGALAGVIASMAIIDVWRTRWLAAHRPKIGRAHV